MMSDSEAPTPKESGSWLMFAQMARDLAERLEAQSMIMSRRLDQLDIDGARACYAMAQELRTMSSDFAKWPELSAELVAISRVKDVPRLMELHRRASELMTRKR